WGDRVGGDAVALHLRGGLDGEQGDARLGGGVVALAHGAEESGAGGGVDDAGRAGATGLGLGAPVGGGVPQRRVVRLEVHGGDLVPLLLGHAHEHLVAQESGVVDQHVEPPVGVDGLLHELRGTVPRGDVVAVDHGLSPGGLDLGHHLLGGVLADVLPVDPGAKSLTTTLAPSAAKASACSRPMPRPAPVTMTTRPSQIPIDVSLVEASCAAVLGQCLFSAVEADRKAGFSPPPWTSSSAPVMYAASGEARKAAACPTSRGSAIRPIGMVASTAATPSSSP